MLADAARAQVHDVLQHPSQIGFVHLPGSMGVDADRKRLGHADRIGDHDRATLGGAPGVQSARFAGPAATDASNNDKLLSLMADVPDEERTARFRCAMAVATAEGRVEVAEGVCEGLITREERGDKGFGYDPLFFVPASVLTFGELPEGIKNAISHRGRALAGAREVLEALLAGES